MVELSVIVKVAAVITLVQAVVPESAEALTVTLVDVVLQDPSRQTGYVPS